MDTHGEKYGEHLDGTFTVQSLCQGCEKFKAVKRSRSKIEDVIFLHQFDNVRTVARSEVTIAC